MSLLALVTSLLIGHQTQPHKKEFMQKYGCQLHNIVKTTEYKDVEPAILAHAALESDWGRASWVEKRKQLFAYLDRDILLGKKQAKKHWHEYLKEFSSFKESFSAQMEYYSRNHYPLTQEKFISFFKKSGYALDPLHSDKISRASNQFKDLINQYCGAEND